MISIENLICFEVQNLSLLIWVDLWKQILSEHEIETGDVCDMAVGNTGK